MTKKELFEIAYTAGVFVDLGTYPTDEYEHIRNSILEVLKPDKVVKSKQRYSFVYEYDGYKLFKIVSQLDYNHLTNIVQGIEDYDGDFIDEGKTSIDDANELVSVFDYFWTDCDGQLEDADVNEGVNFWKGYYSSIGARNTGRNLFD